jgi:hypothetical protein
MIQDPPRRASLWDPDCNGVVVSVSADTLRMASFTAAPIAIITPYKTAKVLRNEESVLTTR